MKPQATLNKWRAEADKLPVPRWINERCVSPGGVPFRVVREGLTLSWQPCTPEGHATGISFRTVEMPSETTIKI